jgi:DNA-binding NarL/FixJ family response regulator
MNVNILLADDHQLMRQGLAALLSKEPELQIIGDASDGRTAVTLAKQHSPDIVLMDITMPDLNGIEATRQITAASPRTRVIGLSAHTDLRNAGEMLRAGAKGYLIKDGVIDEIIVAIKSVMAGNIYLSPKVAGVLKYNDPNNTDPNVKTVTAFVRLSPREREVLQLMAEGRATKEIAADLKVSVKTVETHRRQIMEKLNLFSVAELTKYAIGEGITSPGL